MTKDKDRLLISAWERAFFGVAGKPPERTPKEIADDLWKYGDAFIQADVIYWTTERDKDGKLIQNDDYVVIKSRKEQKPLVFDGSAPTKNWAEFGDDLPLPELLELPRQYGEVCTKCKRDCPHAPREHDFVCWGCRNGY